MRSQPSKLRTNRKFGEGETSLGGISGLSGMSGLILAVGLEGNPVKIVQIPIK